MLLGFSFSSTMQRWGRTQPSSAHHCGIFLVPDKLTTKESHTELFSSWYCYSFVTASPRMCAGGLSTPHEYTWDVFAKVCLKFHPSNFNVQTCLMKKCSCPTLLMNMLYVLKTDSTIGCLL